ncbi:hypothetical protein AB0D11_21480 [Streptomyces monashensis]|uniref:hypothetical protein n=1 Tax=Streptomyces monashensis TaxID=1678012 RepID=UPI0033D01579
MTTMKFLATAALTAASAAALAAPAQADTPTAPTTPTAKAAHDNGQWTISDTANCADTLAVVPVLKQVSPLSVRENTNACGGASLIRPGHRGHLGPHGNR